MAVAAAPSPSYSNLSDPSPCQDDWNRMEKKAFPESASTQPDYLSHDANLLPHLEHRTSYLLTDESAYTCTPWKTKHYSSDPTGLHEEVNDFYEYMKPRPSEVRMRMDVMSRAMNTILCRCRSAHIEPFGSFITGLFLPTSDMDLVVLCLPLVQPSLHALEKDFKDYDIAVEDSTIVLDKLSVPVIKYTDKLTDVKVDISFNHSSGLDSAFVIKQYMDLYPFLPKLVLVLKQFLVEQELNEVYKGGISSYSLILLIVSFLQRHPRYGGTDFSSANLGELLIEFFELYGCRFNYMKTGISVENGGSYISKEDEEVPMQDFLYIRDPTNPNENAAKGCYGMWQVKQAFELAYKRLSSAVLTRDSPVPKRDSILGAIVKVPQDVHDYRNWIDCHWSTHPLSPPSTHIPAPTIYYPAAPVIPLQTMPPVQAMPPSFPYYHQMQPFPMSGEVLPMHQHNIVAASAASYSAEHRSSILTAHNNTAES